VVILMFLDGVLRTNTGSPIYQGLAIYRLFSESNRVVILCKDKEKDDIWLREHKINKLDDLIDHNIPSMTDFPEYRQVEYCRGQGAIELVVTSNPELAKKLLEVGITTLMFLQPAYLEEKFRPDGRQGIRSWKDIKDEIVKQQDSILEDPRIQR